MKKSNIYPQILFMHYNLIYNTKSVYTMRNFKIF